MRTVQQTPFDNQQASHQNKYLRHSVASTGIHNTSALVVCIKFESRITCKAARTLTGAWQPRQPFGGLGAVACYGMRLLAPNSCVFCIHFCIPNNCGVVGTGCDDLLAIRAVARGFDRARMPGQAQKLVAGFEIQNNSRLGTGMGIFS